MTKENKRIEWVDTLKGFAICFMLIGHRIGSQGEGLSLAFLVWICSFHMPLFFFLAGYTFNVERYNGKKGFIDFLCKKIKTLLVPMVCFSVFSICFELFYYGIILKSIDGYDTLINGLTGIIVQGRQIEFGSCYWFLPCIFISEVLFYSIVKILKNQVIPILLTSLFFCIIGYIWIIRIGILLPWCLETSFVTIVFLCIGYITRKKNVVDKIANKYGIGIIMFCLNIVFTYANYSILGKYIDLHLDKLGNIVYFLGQTLTGIFLWVLLFSNCNKLKCIQYIGKNSLIYYCLGDLFMFIPDIFQYNIFHINIHEWGNGGFWRLFSVVIVCIILYPVSNFINKKLPFILGKF